MCSWCISTQRAVLLQCLSLDLPGNEHTYPARQCWAVVCSLHQLRWAWWLQLLRMAGADSHLLTQLYRLHASLGHTGSRPALVAASLLHLQPAGCWCVLLPQWQCQ